MLHYPNVQTLNPSFTSVRLDWTETDYLGCVIDTPSYISPYFFGTNYAASGYVEFTHIDPSSNTKILMVSGVVNLQALSGIETHSPQAILSGYVRLGQIGLGATFTSVSIGATGVTGTNNNFLQVGAGAGASNPTTFNVPSFVNVSHSR